MKPCERCWAPIKNIWGAKHCIQCRKQKDDEVYKAQHQREKEIRNAKKLK